MVCIYILRELPTRVMFAKRLILVQFDSKYRYGAFSALNLYLVLSASAPHQANILSTLLLLTLYRSIKSIREFVIGGLQSLGIAPSTQKMIPCH